MPAGVGWNAGPFSSDSHGSRFALATTQRRFRDESLVGTSGAPNVPSRILLVRWSDRSEEDWEADLPSRRRVGLVQRVRLAVAPNMRQPPINVM